MEIVQDVKHQHMFRIKSGDLVLDGMYNTQAQAEEGIQRILAEKSKKTEELIPAAVEDTEGTTLNRPVKPQK